jgi:hypothetical protein
MLESKLDTRYRTCSYIRVALAAEKRVSWGPTSQCRFSHLAMFDIVVFCRVYYLLGFYTRDVHFHHHQAQAVSSRF